MSEHWRLPELGEEDVGNIWYDEAVISDNWKFTSK